MPLVETISQDHRAIEQLLSELGDTPASQPAARVERFSRLQALLQAHSRAEEEVVYRRLHAHSADEERVLEAYEEHHVADILLQELASACPGGRGWAVKVKVLEELLRQHIKQEEMSLYPLIPAAFDESAVALMEDEFIVLKHEDIEHALGPLRRAMPAFAGRASINAQAAAGRYPRRRER
jgi:hypothetical protein